MAGGLRRFAAGRALVVVASSYDAVRIDEEASHRLRMDVVYQVDDRPTLSSSAESQTPLPDPQSR